MGDMWKALEMVLSVDVLCAPVPSCQLVQPGELGESTRVRIIRSPVRRDLAAQAEEISSSFT